MLFNSIEFVVFFILVTAIFFSLPPKGRLVWLLGASSLFYMWFKPAYIMILLIIICIDYTVGIYLGYGKQRKIALIISLIANIGILSVFKYYNFVSLNLIGLGEYLGFRISFPVLAWALPIGLSFHTFQAMSYTIEVYKRNYPAEQNFLRYALYVMFYPQLVAGPIERPQHLLPQLKLDKSFNYTNVVRGLQRILWGLFKKMVVADSAAMIADAVFNNVYAYQGIGLWIGVACFTIQIYGDFSGYTDIAIGCACIMGIELSENFNAPYLANSLSNFWRRWHISLSSWFRDYVFIPLGGSRVKFHKWLLNILLVFMLSGVWHGANWTFIAWGLLHGIGLISERLIKSSEMYQKIKSINPRILNTLGSRFTILYVSWAWVFFRAKSIHQAIYIYKQAFIPSHYNLSPTIILDTFHKLNFKALEVFLMILWLTIMFLVYEVKQKPSLLERWLRLPYYMHWLAYYFLIAVLIVFGVYEHKEFIYFQF